MFTSASSSYQKKSLIKSAFIFCYIYIFLKGVNNFSFACQITVFVLKQRKNEDIIMQAWPFGFSKNKSKQTLCDSFSLSLNVHVYLR